MADRYGFVFNARDAPRAGVAAIPRTTPKHGRSKPAGAFNPVSSLDRLLGARPCPQRKASASCGWAAANGVLVYDRDALSSARDPSRTGFVLSTLTYRDAV
jgi:hypothetical protein